MQDIFEKRQNLDYGLPCQTDFAVAGINTTYFGLHS